MFFMTMLRIIFFMIVTYALYRFIGSSLITRVIRVIRSFVPRSRIKEIELENKMKLLREIETQQKLDKEIADVDEKIWEAQLGGTCDRRTPVSQE